MLFCLLYLSCNRKDNELSLCVVKTEYKSKKINLIPSLIIISIDGNDKNTIAKIEEGKLSNVILYSIKKKYRDYFLLHNPYEKSKTPNRIKIITSFFDANRSFDNDSIQHIWTQKEIEKTLKGDVGLVFPNDTIKVKMCIAK